MYKLIDSEIKGKIVCYLDFDGDLLIDILVLDGEALTIMLNQKLRFSPLFTLQAKHQDYLCSDFTQDGLVDVLGVDLNEERVEITLYEQINRQFTR
jgi:hypothetical protein